MQMENGRHQANDNVLRKDILTHHKSEYVKYCKSDGTNASKASFARIRFPVRRWMKWNCIGNAFSTHDHEAKERQSSLFQNTIPRS